MSHLLRNERHRRSTNRSTKSWGSSLDDFLPNFQFSEIHQVSVDADATSVYRAIQEVKPDDVRLLGALFFIRGLPAHMLGSRGLEFENESTLLQHMLRSGFVLLCEVEDKELIIGIAGKFWRVRGGISRSVRDAEAFRRFDDPTAARAVMNFRIERKEDEHGVCLSTETRISVPDRSSHLRFGLYWRFISPGSGLIRRMWLRAVKRRAEASSRSS